MVRYKTGTVQSTSKQNEKTSDHPKIASNEYNKTNQLERTKIPWAIRVVFGQRDF